MMMMMLPDQAMTLMKTKRHRLTERNRTILQKKSGGSGRRARWKETDGGNKRKEAKVRICQIGVHHVLRKKKERKSREEGRRGINEGTAGGGRKRNEVKREREGIKVGGEERVTMR